MDVVSIVKVEGAQYALPNYMCFGGVYNVRSPFGSKSKDKGKTKAEDTTSNDSEHQTKLRTFFLNWVDFEYNWISLSDIPLDDPCVGKKMIDTVMRKYKKKSRPIQEFRTEMYAKQGRDETFVDARQRIKRNAQRIRSTGLTIDLVDLADALKGALNPDHVHRMTMEDTYIVTLVVEIEEMFLSMGLHVDQVLAKEHSSSSSTFVSVKSKGEKKLQA